MRPISCPSHYIFSARDIQMFGQGVFFFAQYISFICCVRFNELSFFWPAHIPRECFSDTNYPTFVISALRDFQVIYVLQLKCALQYHC